ncbi:hypothetical protein EW026_g5676 [Hermanssonia centrifuga]|uniref:Uncharacterized protein n=1 Tax=Hermanssonia centrifuga TaxID=98765 RepID=A0A4S4KEH5_9APHY|nr:hypothetical protein EW026_g5676 [Hermanssonia centrifuga]
MSPMDFKPLLTDSRPRDSEALAQETRDGLLQGRCPSAYRSVIFWISITVHGIITITLALALYNDHNHDRHVSCPYDSLLYSPAREAVVYETRPFVLGHADGPAKTLFGAEPSEEVDKAWTDLYNGDTGNYIISLSVFHQLHCLNVMRKALRADYYADPETGNIGNIVKNELHADISPLVWQWSEKARIAKPASDVMHTCRNFDNIVEWAKANQIKHHFDTTTRVEDDIIML